MDNTNAVPNTGNIDNTTMPQTTGVAPTTDQTASMPSLDTAAVPTPMPETPMGAPVATTEPAIPTTSTEQELSSSVSAPPAEPVDASPEVMSPQEPSPALETAPEATSETPFSSQTSSTNMELGPTEQAEEVAAMPPTQEQPAVPAPEANSGQELNIPPEIAAAKANVQNAAGAQMQAGQPAPTAPKKFPLIRIIIIIAAVLVLVGGYFAYGYFTKDKNGSSSDNQYFISE